MFWADTIVEKARLRYKDKIEKGQPLVIRDEKTASGRVHVGSLRGVAIHGIVSEALQAHGVKNTYLFELNDYDPMDGLPVYLDQEKFKPYMGKPLCNVPSPDGKAKNYAEYFADEFIEVIKKAGFEPKFYRSSDVYKSGKYNDAIRNILDNAALIREIYKRVSGAERGSDWYPLSVICENCGNVGSTKAVSWDGEKVEYECGDFVLWAKGCGHRGRTSPFDGNAKLPWKVEWAAKFTVLDVDIEGGGKDHSTKGGAREVADAISREVFKREPPLNIPYEFFVVGGKKMSSSKGAGSSSKEISDLLPTHLLRFLLVSKEPQKVIDFIPDGDTVPVLYDTYDKYAESYFGGKKDDYATVFEYAHIQKERKDLAKKALPRFSTIAYLAQMPHIDIVKETETLLEHPLSKEDKKELDLRIKYAKIWLETFAPEDYRFDIKGELPLVAKSLSPAQKEAIQKILEYIKSQKTLEGQALHTKLHEIRAETCIEPKELFEAIYKIILGKTSGPKAGWFLSVLDKEFLEKRLSEAVNS